MAAELVRFRGSRGLTLVGDLWRGGVRTIVLAHGFTGDRHEDGRFDAAAAALNADGFTVLAFDFAGSGESDDVPLTVEGEVDDLRGALRYARDSGASAVGVLGLSLGALVAARAAPTDRIDALAFWAPLITAPHDPTVWYSRRQLDELAATGHITWQKDNGPRRHIIVDGRYLDELRAIDRPALLSAIEQPVLIVHGSRDHIVPLDGSREALPLLPPGSRLEVVRGADHVFHKTLPRFLRHTRRWFRAWHDAARR